MPKRNAPTADCALCIVCKAPATRTVVIHVDNEPLHMTPDFCTEHANAFILRVGMVIGELVRAHADRQHDDPFPSMVLGQSGEGDD